MARPPREIACELVEDFWNRGGLCTQEYAIDKIAEAIRTERDRIEALEAQAALLGASLTKQQGEIDGLEAERARLRAALEWIKRKDSREILDECVRGVCAEIAHAALSAPSGQEGK